MDFFEKLIGLVLKVDDFADFVHLMDFDQGLD
jgi:hypothetical protein